jgi:hypothetical protein
MIIDLDTSMLTQNEQIMTIRHLGSANFHSVDTTVDVQCQAEIRKFILCNTFDSDQSRALLCA